MPLTKFYIAQNYFEALKSAKSELGEDFLIVAQRKIKVGAILGIFGGRTMVELEVRIEDEPPAQQHSRKNARQKNAPAPMIRQSDGFIDPRTIYSNSPQQAQPEVLQGGVYSQAADGAGQKQSFQPRPSPARDEGTDRILDMMRTMQQQLDSLNHQISKQPQQQIIISPPAPGTPGSANSAHYPPNLQRVYDLLYRAEFCEPLINKIMMDMQTIPESSKEDWEILKEHLRKKLISLCKTAPQISLNDEPEKGPNGAPGVKMPKLVAFVGTTGVGKTTTLAKIATNLVLKAKKKAMLLTIDTYRVAATYQISTYADIIGVPYEIIYKESDFLPCIMKYQDVDVILIDTAGRSQRNNLEVLELRKFLYPGNNIDIEIFLVISSTIKYRDMQDIIKNFGKVNFNKLIFTKTDETTTWGPILSLASEADKPIIYISNGQNVPDDIMAAEAGYVVKKIIDSEELI
jgi:flagellar biosynthesis protein FlhF